jgi:hypothetical protein
MIWREEGHYSSWFPFCSRSAMLGPFVHAAEIVGHLVFEVAMYGVMDIAIAGFGCHNPRDGLMQLCVRPLEQHGTSIELPPKPEPSGKVFTLERIRVVIDVLMEPLSPTDVRFCYSMTQPVPRAAPSWITRTILKHGLGTIFSKMEKVALTMARKDPASPLVQHVSSVEYAPTADSLRACASMY